MEDLEKSKFYPFLINLNRMLMEYDELGVPHKSGEDLIKWYIEATKKNTIIYKSKKDGSNDNETYKKYRKHVYWIDLGANIGSEFGGYHYAVVIKESKCTAVIVPFTSRKLCTPGWLAEDDVLVDIGTVMGGRGYEVPAYACVSRIQSVSKKRLDRCSDGNGFVDIKLTDEQMDLIDNMIKSKLTKPMKKTDPLPEEFLILEEADS